MSRHVFWPRWRAIPASLWRRAVAYRHALVSRGQVSRERLDHQSARVSRAHVLRVLVQHEFAKHPERVSDGMDEALAQHDEKLLARLLIRAGWPPRRVHRIRRLQWFQTALDYSQLSIIQLAPVPWVLALGGGSTNALQVAEGARKALLAENTGDRHVAAIRAALREPPHPRVLVLRECGNKRIVEDGNHFVIAMLIRGQQGENYCPVPALVGQRTVSVPAVQPAAPLDNALGEKR